MVKKPYFTIVILFFIVFSGVFLWVSSKNSNQTDIKNAYRINPVDQNITNRNWENLRFEVVSDSIPIYNAVNITSHNAFFYADDWSNNTITKIDTSGSIIQTFGMGKGEGPGEFLRINSIDIDVRGRLWVADESNGRITIFNQDGNWNIFQPPVIPNKVVSLDENKYIVRNRFDSQLIANSTDKEFSFKTEPILFEEGTLWANVFQSFFTRSNDNTFIRVFRFTNEIVKYNEQGEIIYFRRPIEPFDVDNLQIIPPRKYDDNQEVWFNEVHANSQKPKSNGVHIFNERIHILIASYRENQFYGDIIDVYSLETGEYIHSYKIPEPLYEFAVTENILAGIEQETGEIGIWKIYPY